MFWEHLCNRTGGSAHGSGVYSWAANLLAVSRKTGFSKSPSSALKKEIRTQAYKATAKLKQNYSLTLVDNP